MKSGLVELALQRQQPRVHRRWPRISTHGTAPRLRANEVSRHAVQLVTFDRAANTVGVAPFASLASKLRAGDLVVVNDAATFPASLRGSTEHGAALELRLSAPIDDGRLVGVLFGRGDWRTRTEHRPAPPPIRVGDRIDLGAISAVVVAIEGRRVELVANVRGDALWAAIYASALPVQYAHRTEQLPLYAVQTAYAARPWAAEMPSAGRPLTWSVVLELRRGGIEIATLTHAAGLGATGDDALDRLLPWPERYEVPARTERAIQQTRSRGGRVVAIGTSVVRALEASGGRSGEGIACNRIDRSTQLAIVDGIVSGLHVPGESHFDLLEAFAPHADLDRILAAAVAADLSGHELGDACLIV